MRINIKTGGRVIDKDVRALYIINEGLNMISEKMKKVQLEYFADKLGYKLTKKDNALKDEHL